MEVLRKEAIEDRDHVRLLQIVCGLLVLKGALVLYAMHIGIKHADVLLTGLSIISGVVLVTGLMRLIRPLDWLLIGALLTLATLPLFPYSQHDLSALIGVDVSGVRSFVVTAIAAFVLKARLLWEGVLIGYSRHDLL